MNTKNHTLLALVAAAKRGESNAREALYYQYCKAMFNLSIRMCGNEADAHDIMQEGFITAFEKIEQLKDENAFGGWLKRIMISQCIAWSKQRNKYTALVSEDDGRAEEKDESWWDTISMAQLHEAIKKLPDGCRQVFVLYAVEDYSHQQVADELGVTTGTSKSQYSRAKGLLQQILLKKMAANG